VTTILHQRATVAATAAAERAKAEQEAIEEAAALARARDKRCKDLDVEAAERREELWEAEQALAKMKAQTCTIKRLYELEHRPGSVQKRDWRCLGDEYVQLASEYGRLKATLPGLKQANASAKAAARAGTKDYRIGRPIIIVRYTCACACTCCA
jgi:hypothetical protein